MAVAANSAQTANLPRLPLTELRLGCQAEENVPFSRLKSADDQDITCRAFPQPVRVDVAGAGLVVISVPVSGAGMMTGLAPLWAKAAGAARKAAKAAESISLGMGSPFCSPVHDAAESDIFLCAFCLSWPFTAPGR